VCAQNAERKDKAVDLVDSGYFLLTISHLRRRSLSTFRHFASAASKDIAPGEAVECFNPNAAVMRAEALSRKPGHVGAVAFSRTGDPATGDFGDAKVIRKFGEVPDDLSAL
jgi:hypothetical protein